MKSDDKKSVDLPKLMVAPNGARLTKADHPQLPVTIGETVEAVIACAGQGADGVHAHIRDQDQKHLLDAGIYRELLDEFSRKLPGFYVQVTTESVGKYSPTQQRDLVYELSPPAVSIALREIEADGDNGANRHLFHWAKESGTRVQHILYEPGEIRLLRQRVDDGIIPANDLQLLFVLGRYTENQVSNPDTVEIFVNELEHSGLIADWAVCAFGINETACLLQSFALGGKARVGFENNMLNRNGSLASSNAERVAEVCSVMAGM